MARFGEVLLVLAVDLADLQLSDFPAVDFQILPGYLDDGGQTDPNIQGKFKIFVHHEVESLPLVWSVASKTSQSPNWQSGPPLGKPTVSPEKGSFDSASISPAGELGSPPALGGLEIVAGGGGGIKANTLSKQKSQPPTPGGGVARGVVGRL